MLALTSYQPPILLFIHYILILSFWQPKKI
nr:MAG TPA: hypothetical protein [Caudoviricetes sp.]